MDKLKSRLKLYLMNACSKPYLACRCRQVNFTSHRRKIEKEVEICRGTEVSILLPEAEALMSSSINVTVVVNEINEASKLHAVAQRDTGSIDRCVRPEICPLRDGGWLHGHHTRHLRE